VYVTEFVKSFDVVPLCCLTPFIVTTEPLETENVGTKLVTSVLPETLTLILLPVNIPIALPMLKLFMAGFGKVENLTVYVLVVVPSGAVTITVTPLVIASEPSEI